MAGITVAPSFRSQRALAELAAPTLDAATTLKQHAEAIRLLARRACRDIVEIGYHLTEAKELAAHGKWLRWLDQEFGWSEQTARNYMRVYEMAKSTTVVDLNLPLRSLYSLAAPSTPKAARDEIIERVERGETVLDAEVKEIIAKAKASLPTPPIKPVAKPPNPAPYVYAPDEIIDQIFVLFSQLAPTDQHRCVLRLRNFLRGL
jgi:hypothetical protein